ncbi:MAG TPA: methyltransferase domain-containing protein [Candidatus Synoicihabitans sp.]|nr:methyltransferase domain-containing protein [Candidatus Synoicihabitans sp.]
MPASDVAPLPAAPVARSLTGQIERFDSFWEGPADVAKGYRTFGQFYRVNYLRHLPADRAARILVVSCGSGYFVNLLRDQGYRDIVGIDSDPTKIAYASARNLPCRVATAFEFLAAASAPYDVIICEQELNHLTKVEMLEFLRLVESKLRSGGRLICHGLNGANPIVGAETLAQNFDHFNTFTAYSFQQVLEHSGFRDVHVFGLNLYVFYRNPLNYVAWTMAAALSLGFRLLFRLYGKSNRIFTKKLGAVATRSA